MFVPVRGSVYAAVSREVMAILRRYTDQVEPISIDEAFLDVTGSRALFGDGASIARSIKTAVNAETQLTASVGVATTKLVAKIASDLRKPDGLVVVAPGTEPDFLDPLAIARCGVSVPRPPRRCANTAWPRSATSGACRSTFSCGCSGPMARRCTIGRSGSIPIRWRAGIRPSRSGMSTRSIRTRPTSTRSSGPSLAMADGVAGRLRAAGLRAGTVAVKIRDSSFRTITRQRPLVPPTDMTEPIWRAALELVRPEVRGMRVRLLGVTCSNFGDQEQLALFAGEPRTELRRRQAVEAADELRRRYGQRAVTRGRLIGTGLPAPFERDPRTAPERRVGSRRTSLTNLEIER